VSHNGLYNLVYFFLRDKLIVKYFYFIIDAPSSPQPEELNVPTALADFIHQQRLLTDNSTNRYM
jgi:hypothetical protein